MISSINSVAYNDYGFQDSLKFKIRSVVKKESPAEKYSSNVWKKVDSFLDFGSSMNLNFNNLSEQEFEQFLKIMSTLMKKGIVGWKYYEVNGQIEKHYMVTSIGDQRLSNAVPKKWNKPDGYY